MTRFMDYYSPFWGPKAISIVVEPQGALTCRSSTLIDLADSIPFHGLLLTVLRSESDFHDERTLGAFTCRSSTLVVFVDCDPFVDYYSPFWGPIAISIVVEPQGALTRQSSTLACLVDCDPFRGLLLTVLGSRSDFHSY